MKDVALIIFIKNLQLGKVKTRIGKSVGDQQALEIYTQLCTFTIEEVKKSGLQAYFYFSDHIDYELLNSRGVDTESDLYTARVQMGTDLGIRMYHAFEEVLEDHDAAFILGTDCPYFDALNIVDAVDRLLSDKINIVIGPAEDGGYYGLGMKQNWNVFSDVAWSTSQVFKQTLGRIEKLNLKCIQLPKRNDMDYETDWVEFLESPSSTYFQEVIRSSSLPNDTVDA